MTTAPQIQGREIMISIDALRVSNVESNVLPTTDYFYYWLAESKKVCQRNRDAYNVHSEKLRFRHNLISIPLLAITSGTSVVAALQVNTVLTTVLGAAAAVSTAIQRFCAFAERAENARMTAKGFARIARNIESALLYVRSPAIVPEPLFYTKLVEEIKKDLDHVTEQATEVPWELLKFIETLDTVRWWVPKVMKGHRAEIRTDLFA